MKDHRILEKSGWWILALAMVGFFCWLRGFSVCEYDLFWQIRAGREILHTAHVSAVESWSYITRGQPWYNFEWLSCVVDYLCSLTPPLYGGLYYLRAVLMGSCMLMQACIIRKFAKPGVSSWVALILLIPSIFTVMLARFQMRPDLFATDLFLILLLLWLSEMPRLTKKIAGLALVLLWANFHSGTVPFGILFYSTAVLATQDPQERLTKRAWELLWIVGAACAWIATPIGIHVFDVIRGNVVDYDFNTTHNLDFEPFSFSMLHGLNWIYVIWPVYSVFGAVAYVWMVLKRPQELPSFYRRWFWIALAGAIMIFLGYRKIRCIQYAIFFLLPVFVTAIASLCRKSPRKALLLALNLAVLFCWFYVPLMINRTTGMRARTIVDWDLPIKSVEFIKRTHPAQNLLNTYNYGGYIIAELPEYPVAWDTREIPFLEIRRRYKKMFDGGRPIYRQFLDELSVSTVLMPYPAILNFANTGLTDAYAINYPKEEWALVYFDDVSVVLLRRNAQNDPIIRQNEYHFIRPGMPEESAAQSPQLSAEDKKGWESDADRCLADNPENTYCLLVKAAFTAGRGDLAQARAYCNEAKQSNPVSQEVTRVCQ